MAVLVFFSKGVPPFLQKTEDYDLKTFSEFDPPYATLMMWFDMFMSATASAGECS